MLFSGGGEGTLIPPSVFCSWSVALTRWIWPSLSAFFILCGLYYLILFLAVSIGSRKGKKVYPFLITLIHFVGVVVVLLSKPDHSEADTATKIMSLLISSVVFVLYLWTDWMLAGIVRKR